ncbi:MAG TPA: hypothetical protein VNN79_18955 [Actinomycetota bacterium]|nr:hypothetical protein [Actinomycetota bacterium]
MHHLGAWKLDEALLVAGYLRSNGIPAVAEGDSEPHPAVALGGGTALGMVEMLQGGGLVRVDVRADDLESAREAVQSLDDVDDGS